MTLKPSPLTKLEDRAVKHEPAFDGETYDEERDEARLTGQMARVYELMRDGEWRTLGWIAALCNGSEAGISARLRDLRKEKFGGHTVERQHVENGLHRYRLIVAMPKPKEPDLFGWEKVA